MKQPQADLLANHLLNAHLTSVDMARYFMTETGSPPSSMAKVHVFRSAVQGRLATDDRYELNQAYHEFGRVQFADLEHGGEFLLRSTGAVGWEGEVQRQPGLFAATPYVKPSGIVALVYNFDRNGLELLPAPTTAVGQRNKLMTFGQPTMLGHWPYILDEETGTSTFDQADRDWFGDIGDIDEDDLDGGGKA